MTPENAPPASAAPSVDPPNERPSLGLRALGVALRELATGIREVPPGSNDGPRLRDYFAGAVRWVAGKLGSFVEAPVRVRGVPWCAAFASYCGETAREAGEELPHAWRLAVHELVEDAGGSLRSNPPPAKSDAWREGSYIPQPGDLAVFRRGGADPRHGGEGHVARVERVAGSLLTTIDGNHNDRIERVERDLSKQEPGGELVGFIAYDDPPPDTARSAR